MKRLIHILIATAVFAPPAFAHDPKLHKGPKIEGEVVSLKDDRLDVGTKDGTVAVTLSPDTTFEQGESGKKAERGTLKQGQHVMVAGHKLGSGGFVATAVMIHGDHKKGGAPHGHESEE
jgi:hypothetical protein